MILDDIVNVKKEYLLKSEYTFDVKRLYDAMEKPVADFKAAMAKEGLSIIGEVKKASPSRGLIKPDFEPVKIAKEYEGAVDAISVLTEEKFFMGSPEYLRDIHKNVDLPLLRKDFVISPLQIFEAREMGASAILLIAAVLNDVRVLKEYINIARGVGFEPLVETHNEEEIELALEAGADIIGINNRNLKDFTEDIYTTVRLRELIPDDKIVLSESSIHTAEDIRILKKASINGILVGESFMKCDDIKAKAKEFKEAYGC
ncbi:MAG: indole-3-glycerol phosphate synthase TrpC [Clostridia bacterium]|nr:indole-3-glycerol phosphate synthase TrpC [Clostridia bacterium]